MKQLKARWSLPTLSVRDAAASNLAEALDFSIVRRRVRNYAFPQFRSVECPVS